MASLSNPTGVVLVDSRSTSGTITLPLSTETPGRTLIFKDAYGSFGSNSLLLSTSSGDLFENGSNLLTISGAFDSVSLVAGGNSVWYQTNSNSGGGTNPASFTSTVEGLGTAGYISTISPELTSTVSGLGTAGYISSLSNPSPSLAYYLSSNLALPDVTDTVVLFDTADSANTNGTTACTYNSNTGSFSNGTSATVLVHVDTQVATDISTTEAIRVMKNASSTDVYGNYAADTYTLATSATLILAPGEFCQIYYNQASGNSANITGSAYKFTRVVFTELNSGGSGGINSNVSNTQMISTVSGLGSAGYISSFVSSYTSLNSFKYNIDFLSTMPFYLINTNLSYSYDLSTWLSNLTFNFTANRVIYNSNIQKYITIGYDPIDPVTFNYAYYSLNGKFWTLANQYTTGYGNIFKAIDYSPDLTIITGSKFDGTGYPTTVGTIQYSSNGINWHPNVSGGFLIGYAIKYVSTNLWLAGGVDATNSNIQYSVDGSNWSNATSYSNIIPYSFAGHGSVYVTVGYSSNTSETIQWSTDGLSWTSAVTGGFNSMSDSTYVGAVGWNGSLFVATGLDSSSNSQIQISSDGSNWSPASNCFGPGKEIKYIDSLWYVIGSNGIQTSSDGYNWTLASAQAGGSIEKRIIAEQLTNTLYVSSAGLLLDGEPLVKRNDLESTVKGLGSASYISSFATGLASTVAGLGTAGYISTIPEYLEVSSINAYSISTVELIVTGASTLTVTGNVALFEQTTVNRLFASSITNQSTIQFIDQYNGNEFPIYAYDNQLYFNSNLLVPSQGVTSTVAGLGSAGYISSLDNFIPSTVTGLGSAGYISSLIHVQTVSSMAIQAHSVCTLQTVIGALYYSYVFL